MLLKNYNIMVQHQERSWKMTIAAKEQDAQCVLVATVLDDEVTLFKTKMTCV